jgi:UDPglucose--hexose-1-phosphate uridylyltransferase
MVKIPFENVASTFTILNPFNNFAAEEHRVEVRKDPLLGDTSVYNPFLKDKARLFFGENDAELVKKLAEDNAKTCIFCGENVMQKTATYPAVLIPEGRMRVGEAVLFANAFSVGKYHPVIALSKAHFLKPSEFSPDLLTDGFKASQEFLRSVYREDPSAIYATVNANYLFPAGASLVHPHLQMLVTPVAYSYQARLLNASRLYRDKNGSSYFDDLVHEEKRISSRYIAQKGNWHWLATFSPMGSNEIMAVHEKETDFGSLSESDLRDLSYGISKVLSFYESLGRLSFNFALFSVRKGAEAEGFRCVFKIISRQNLYANYRNDDYFLQKMLQSELIFDLPEELAERLRKAF